MKRRFTRGWMGLLILGLIWNCAAYAEAPTYEGSGFATPEEAVVCYLEGAKALDLQKMIGAFAVETYVQHFDIEAYIKNMGMYSFISYEIKLPNSNAFFVSANIESRRSEIERTILRQLVALQYPQIDWTTPAYLNDESGEVYALLEQMQNTQTLIVETLEPGEFMEPETLSEHYASANTQSALEKRVVTFGADELRSMAVAFTAAEQRYVFTCDAVRYGDKWYLANLQGMLGTLMGISIYAGGIMPMEGAAA